MSNQALQSPSTDETARLELWTGGPIPACSEIPTVAGMRFEVIKKYEFAADGYRFLHGLAIARHGDRWFASFGHNKGAENTGGEVANCVVSSDGGRTWGSLIPIDTPTGNLAVSHGAFLAHNDTLRFFAGSFAGDISNGCHTRAYVWDDVSESWNYKGVAARGGFFPMQEPQELPDGNWIMAGLSVIPVPDAAEGSITPPAVAISRGTDFTAWDVVHIASDVPVWGECALIVADSEVQLISRGAGNGSPIAYTSTSRDYGRTWTKLRETNLPLVLSKPYAGILSTGQKYLVSTIHAEPTWRNAMCIALSKPGEATFTSLLKIRESVHEGPGESHPKAQLAYPYAVEHDGELWVAYSNDGGGVGRTGEGRELWNNNSAELAVIPLASLQVG